MEMIVIFVCGSTFFPSIFLLSKRILVLFTVCRLENNAIYAISVSCVSALQAVLSCLVGATIVIHCQNDIMKDRHWLTNAYAAFAMPYFYYDIWAMCQAHLQQHPEVQKKGRVFAMKHFFYQNQLIVLHHLFCPLVLAPAILFFRHGIGDFFVGVLYLIELSTPFLSARNIMKQLNMKDSKAYLIVGLLMVSTFFVCRILIFPFLYWKYSQHAGIPVGQVPWSIPMKCTAGCLVVLAPQVYWFGLMFQNCLCQLHTSTVHIFPMLIRR
ncbi:hypothetical protein ScPMuIL_007215 [Solemya velum]